MEHLSGIYGLCLVIGGVIALTVPQPARQLLAWRWLAAFAFLDGLVEWLELFDEPPLPWLHATGDGLTAITMLLLIEGLRRSLKQGGRDWCRWWLTPAVALMGTGLGLAAGIDHAVAGIQLPAAGAALLLAVGPHPQATARTRLGLRLALAGLTAYALLEAAGIWTGLEDDPTYAWPRVVAVLLVSAGWLMVSIAACPPAARRGRTRDALVSLAVVIAILLLGSQIAAWNSDQMRQGLTHAAHAEADRVANQMTVMDATGELAAEVITLWPETTRVLAGAGGIQALEQLANRIDAFAFDRHIDLILVLDLRGITVASNLRGTPRSPVGHSFVDRSYFTQAMTGETGRTWAVGRTTGKPGFYSSRPVHDAQGRIIGVTVVKYDTDRLVLNDAQREMLHVLASPEGVVFAASDARFLGHLIHPLPKEAQDALAASHQFGPGPFPLLWDDGLLGNVDGRSLLVARAGPGVEGIGWTSLSLARTGPADLAQLVITGLTLLACLVVLSVLGVMALFDERRWEVRAERQRLAEREARLSLVLETVHEGIVVLDDRGFIVSANRAVQVMVGSDEAGLVGHPLEAISGLPALANVQGIARIRRDDGHEIPVECTVRVGENAGGRLQVVVLRDLREQMRAEHETGRALDLLNSVIDLAPTPILLKDARGIILLANRAACAYFRCEPDQAIGRSPAELMPDGLGSDAEDAHLVPGQETTGERGYADARGTIHHLRTLKRGLAGDGGGCQVLSVSMDITELKTALAAAESADHAKGAFLASFSHELRTPLNGVLGMTELLLRTRLAADQEEYASTAYRSAGILLALLNDILDYSKIAAGQLELESTAFDLVQMVGEVLDLFRARALEQGIELVFDTPARPLPPLVGDPLRLRQIVSNLVANAVKFTAKGHVLVAIEARPEGDGRLGIGITIEDTGIGIPPERLARLFTAFQQADATIARRFGGSGLGLVISQRLAQAMGGDIGVRSQEGVGSRFRVDLSLPCRGEATVPWAQLPPGLPVLVVDDHPLARGLLARHLAESGCAVTQAASAGEGLLALSLAAGGGRPCAVAIVDQQLPDLDGEALARAMMAEPRLRGTRLLLTTSHGRPDPDRLAGAGIAGCLEKPLHPDLLRRMLATLVARPDGGPPLTRRDLVGDGIPATGGRALDLDVLLVEDNHINQRVATLMLERLGARVTVLGDGALAVEHLRRGAICDLVLMDLLMPQLDGLQATVAIRALPQTGLRRLPIIAMTANTASDERERCLDAGMNDFLAKPISEDALRRVLERWGRRRRPA